MSPETASLLRAVDTYLRRNPGIAESTLGREAVNDGKLIGRLREGGRCWPDTEAKVRTFMAKHTYPVVRRKVAA